MAPPWGSFSKACWSAAPRRAQRAQNLLAVDLVRTVPGQVVETEALPSQDAFHVVLQLRDLPVHDLWLGGRPVQPAAYPRHSISIGRPFRAVPLPHRDPSRGAAVLHPAARTDRGSRRVREVPLRWPPPCLPAWRRSNPVMARLGAALLSRLDGRGTHRLWIDQLLLLVQAHVFGTYGSIVQIPTLHKGGLALWQERRAKEVIEEGLARPLALSEIAREVSLSPSHFARSFKRSTGLTPYGWLTRRRMEIASAMLAAGQQPIAAIAEAMGYAEQSSFTRAFVRHIGQTPAAFARRQDTRPRAPWPTDYARIGTNPA